MSVNEARGKFFEAKKAVEKAELAKKKLAERLAFLKLEIEDCSSTENQRKELVLKLATGEIAQIAYDKKIAELQKEAAGKKLINEQISAIEEIIEDSSDEGSKARQALLECEKTLFLAIAETLEGETRMKIPGKDLSMLAFCRLHSGRAWGIEGWEHLLLDVCGQGSFTDTDLKATEAEIKKQYGF